MSFSWSESNTPQLSDGFFRLTLPPSCPSSSYFFLFLAHRIPHITHENPLSPIFFSSFFFDVLGAVFFSSARNVAPSPMTMSSELDVTFALLLFFCNPFFSLFDSHHKSFHFALCVFRELVDWIMPFLHLIREKRECRENDKNFFAIFSSIFHFFIFFLHWIFIEIFEGSKALFDFIIAHRYPIFHDINFFQEWWRGRWAFLFFHWNFFLLIFFWFTLTYFRRALQN